MTRAAPPAEAFPPALITLPTALATASALAFTASGSSSSGGILQPGVRYWGACGHLDQGGPYQAISYATQASYLKNIFGSTPNTVLYRAFGDGRAHNQIGNDVTAFQAENIIPVVMVCTYPDWGSFANETAAYNYAYNEVSDVLTYATTAQVFEIGNEWNLQVAQPGGVDGEDPSDWTGLSFYPLFLGATAGAIQAIRDNAVADAQIIGGATSGWVKIGFVPALADDLASDYGLAWDFTCLHWYHGEQANLDFGLPTSISGTGSNAWQKLRPSTATPKPVLVTEFGASTQGSSDATSATRTTDLMDAFYTQGVSGSGTQLGCVGGMAFELFSTAAFPDYKLYSYTSGSSATIAAQGTAVKNWIAAHP